MVAVPIECWFVVKASCDYYYTTYSIDFPALKFHSLVIAMDEMISMMTKLRSKATKLCNDLRAYRQGDSKLLDQDQLALKMHHVEKVGRELRDVQIQLDKEGRSDD